MTEHPTMFEFFQDNGQEGIENLLPIFTFALLKEARKIGPEVLDAAITMFRNFHEKGIEARYAIKFLEIGKAYFFDDGPSALLRLVKEDRKVFCEQLNLTFPENI